MVQVSIEMSVNRISPQFQVEPILEDEAAIYFIVTAHSVGGASQWANLQGFLQASEFASVSILSTPCILPYPSFLPYIPCMSKSPSILSFNFAVSASPLFLLFLLFCCIMNVERSSSSTSLDFVQQTKKLFLMTLSVYKLN